MVFWFATGIIRYPHSQRQKKNQIRTDNKSGLEKLLLAIVSLGMLILPVLFVITPLLDFANYELPTGLSIVGIVLIPISLWLFYKSHKDLGRNWSPSLEVTTEHTLITEGVYKHIRHPMYSAIWLWVIIQALLLHNYIAGPAGMVTFALLYFLRVDVEENMMLQEFGDSYANYIKRSGRLFPKF